MYSGEEFILKLRDGSQITVLFQVLCKYGTLLLLASDLFSRKIPVSGTVIINLHVFSSMKCISLKAAVL